MLLLRVVEIVSYCRILEILAFVPVQCKPMKDLQRLTGTSGENRGARLPHRHGIRLGA